MSDNIECFFCSEKGEDEPTGNRFWIHILPKNSELSDFAICECCILDLSIVMIEDYFNDPEVEKTDEFNDRLYKLVNILSMNSGVSDN